MVQDLSRRSFLRSILLGAVAPAIIKPKSFFSFFTGEVWKPKVYEGVFLSGSVLTLNDIAKRMPHDQQLIKIAELLAQHNPILDDVIWMPSNEPMRIREVKVIQ